MWAVLKETRFWDEKGRMVTINQHHMTEPLADKAQIEKICDVYNFVNENPDVRYRVVPITIH